MSRILITGGSGFIGLNLMTSLLNNGHQVLNIDLVPSPIHILNNHTKICDIRQLHEIEPIIMEYNPEYIVHLAARTDLDGKNLSDYSSNTLGVQNIIEIVKKLTSLKKILITSSMLVCKAGYRPLSQDDYCPTTLYGVSKVETERITKEAELNCSWALLRPTSIWGPWFKVPYRNFFDMVRQKKYFHIGHKSCTKTYGYIGNAIYQIECILFSDTSDNPNHVYYLGDYPTNIEEWANEIANEEGYKIIRLPYFILKMAALFGDFLKSLKIRFPMTSFRLKNMTTDNILSLDNTFRYAPNLPYTRIEGIKETISWLKSQDK